MELILCPQELNKLLKIFFSFIADDKQNFTSYELVDRDGWDARPVKNKLDLLKLPVHRVVILHTASDNCDSIVRAFS